MTSEPITAAGLSFTCHLCGQAALASQEAFGGLERVTSDCKPWPSGGTLALCRNCGLVQTAVTDSWQDEVNRIYKGYTIYHQAQGIEQTVFDASSGTPSPRSGRIAEALIRHLNGISSGRLLDIGCGNGAFLNACSRQLQGWRFAGTEFDEKYKSQIERIPGVERLHVGDLSSIEGRFDVISLIHVLEHIPSPHGVLDQAMRRLDPGGLLLVEVPDCARNPFMLTVADHCSHFSVQGLTELVRSRGFEILLATDQWISKEVTLIGRKPQTSIRAAQPILPRDEARKILSGVAWLLEFRNSVSKAAVGGDFGIFGTSIGATWLDAELRSAARFFVDEDPNRAGRRHLNRPILPPDQLPPAACVAMALPRPLADSIAARLRQPGLTFMLPPE